MLAVQGSKQEELKSEIWTIVNEVTKLKLV